MLTICPPLIARVRLALTSALTDIMAYISPSEISNFQGDARTKLLKRYYRCYTVNEMLSARRSLSTFLLANFAEYLHFDCVVSRKREQIFISKFHPAECPYVVFPSSLLYILHI